MPPLCRGSFSQTSLTVTNPATVRLANRTVAGLEKDFAPISADKGFTFPLFCIMLFIAKTNR